MKPVLGGAILSLFLSSPAAWAIGPRNTTTGGLAVQWSSMPVTVHLDGDLDVRGKDVGALVNEAIAAWVDLADSDVTMTIGSLGEAIDGGNVCVFLYDSLACLAGPMNDGTNPLVIDEDGAIAADFFGPGNRFTTLGFASIINYNTSTGAAIKGEAVFNAACLSEVEVAGCGVGGLSFSNDDFTSFIVHELGHFLGLDHSQVNLAEAEDDDTSNDNLITTMFPTFIPGNGANFKTPDRDDAVGLAQLYPSSSFTSGTWTIQGTVYEENGTTELQCANVVARNVSNPTIDAIAAISGDFAAGGAEEGSYEIPGLTAGASYTLEVEPIASGYTGASGYTPCRGSSGEPSPPQFATLTTSTTFTGSAGETQTVNCILGNNCFAGGSDGDGDSGGSGGCSLIQ